LEDKDVHIAKLLTEMEALKSELFDANNIIDAIKEGSVDALVLHHEGEPQIYSIESADYTYRILIEKFSEGALSITYDGLILYCNDAFGKLAGISCEKITGSYLPSYFDVPQDFKYFIDAINTGKSKGEIFLIINNTKTPVNISFTDLHPTVNAIGVVVTDLTEKKKHEQALYNYQRDLEAKVNELHVTNTNLSQFIHVISHDLKEPLRKMLMYTSRLNPDLYAVEAHNPLNVIKLSAERLNSLVDDLGRYAFTVLIKESVPVNLNNVLSETIDDLEVIIEEKNAKVTSDSLPVVLGSGVQIRQLLSNLIINAIKYSREGVPPEISITSDIVSERDGEAKKWHIISIRDNGIGMDNSHLSKIFTIFQRLHHRNEYSGNGIGLAISKKIMENHSGKITVESTLHEGSVFRLYFPAGTQPQ
jgi:PAS domain S-box-containing protein